MTMRNEWRCQEHQPGHESLYYAVIDLKGRLLSMNAAMSKEFGIGSPNRVTSFQMLLQEKDVQNFNSLLQAKDQGTATDVPASLYTFSGTDRTPIKWSFFHLISGVTPNGTILCAGNTNQLAACAEDIAVIKKEQEEKQQEDATISPSQMKMLLKILDNERLLIGQELHDNVNQLLCTAKLHLDLIQVFKDDNVEAKKTSLELLMEAIEAIKKLSKGLVLQQLKRDTLLESINAFVEDFKLITKINVVFGIHHFNEDLLRGTKKINIFRIVQEQFRNIMQHSNAKTVVMTLETDEQNIELIIDDDGIGFDPDAQVSGIGLINIRERARLLNGHCDIITSPGHGCRLHVVIPIH